MLTLTDAFRFACSLGVVLFSLAIGIGRLSTSPAPHREPAPPIVTVSSYACHFENDEPFWLEPERVTLERFPIPRGEHASYLRTAPWQDATGATQAVGRWWGTLAADKTFLSAEGPGVARFAFPSGKVLDRIPTGATPSSPPCWFPDNPESILYAAADGVLYRLDFNAPRLDRHPRAVRWAMGEPGYGPSQIFDPEWPTDPRFHRTVIVALATNNGSEVPNRLDPTTLWWLRLDATQTAIEAAGRLEWPGADPSHDRRYPVVSVQANGDLTLVSLSRAPGEPRWRLERAAIRLDHATGAVAFAGTPSQILSEDLFPTTPAITADGRGIVVMRQGARGTAEPTRLLLDDSPATGLATNQARTVNRRGRS